MSLTSISLPSSLRYIGKYALYYCCRLSFITINYNRNIKLEDEIFYGCDNIKRIVIKLGNEYDIYGIELSSIEWMNKMDRIFPNYVVEKRDDIITVIDMNMIDKLLYFLSISYKSELNEELDDWTGLTGYWMLSYIFNYKY